MAWRDRLSDLLDPPKGTPRLDRLAAGIERLRKAGPIYSPEAPNETPARLVEEPDGTTAGG
jgi:hypothetical protein